VDVASLSVALHRRQQIYITRARDAASQMWAGVDPANLSGTWSPQVARMVGMVASGKQYNASGATDYVSTMLSLQGVAPEPAGVVASDLFGASAADGRPLGSLLYMPAIHGQQALASGMSESAAWQVGLSSLQMIVATEVADAGRSAVGVGMMSDRRVTGYVRTLSSAPCGRCSLLADKWYSTFEAASFERHPRCNCSAAPAADRKSIAPAKSNSDAYFRSLTSAQQDKVFTKAGAQAIRDGADMSQVVNARRGMSAVQQWTTTEGTTTRGVFGGYTDAGRAAKVRLTPEGIYKLSATREESVSMLREYGYLT